MHLEARAARKDGRQKLRQKQRKLRTWPEEKRQQEQPLALEAATAVKAEGCARNNLAGRSRDGRQRDGVGEAQARRDDEEAL